MPSYVLEYWGGFLPTQAWGRTAGDRPFYFRARHGTWILEVGDPGWPTNYLEWPDDCLPSAEPFALGDDPSWGTMEQADVEAILARELEGH